MQLLIFAIRGFYFCRLVRGFALDKPILLEGPPGCGKSSTVVALAAVTGHPLTRLNLSEQTVEFFSIPISSFFCKLKMLVLLQIK